MVGIHTRSTHPGSYGSRGTVAKSERHPINVYLGFGTSSATGAGVPDKRYKIFLNPVSAGLLVITADVAFWVGSIESLEILRNAVVLVSISRAVGNTVVQWQVWDETKTVLDVKDMRITTIRFEPTTQVGNRTGDDPARKLGYQGRCLSHILAR